MRIAVVTRYFPSSGEPAQGRSLYETLRIVGITAEVRVFYPNASYPSILRPRSRIYHTLDPAFSVPGVSAEYHDFFALPLVTRPLNAWIAFLTLLPHVRGFDPDLILGCFLYPAGFAALKIGKALDVPVVAMSIGSDINGIGDPVSAQFTRSVLREVDFLITVSEDLRKKAIAMGAAPAKTRTILNGCNLSVFHVMDRRHAREHLKIDPGFQAALFVGGIDNKKGVWELVAAAAMLHAHRPTLHFYLVGDGPDKSSLEGHISSLDAASYVHLVGGCAFDDVAVWITAADLVTLPSHMEGCPNVVLEAIACGRPVVATNVGGIPEIMCDACGCLVAPRDVAKLAEAISSVLERPWNPEAISSHWTRSWNSPAMELLETCKVLVAN